MGNEKRGKLIKVKCPTCKLRLLIRPSVKVCPACRSPLTKPGTVLTKRGARDVEARKDLEDISERGR